MPTPARSPVHGLPGIGPAAARALQRRGIRTVLDLLFLLPRDYHDERALIPLSELESGTRAVTAGVVAAVHRTGQRRRSRLEVSVEPLPEHRGGRRGVLKLVWFHAASGQASRFARGKALRIAGEVTEYRGVAQMAHPDVRPLGAGPGEGAIVPRYPEVSGIAPRNLEKAMRAAVDGHVDAVRSLVPGWVEADAGWLPLSAALRHLHRPSRRCTDDELRRLRERTSEAHERLAREELFLLELVLARRRRAGAGGRAEPAPGLQRVEAARAALPFSLTAAQRRVVTEIGTDLARDRPMTRLLQGDVGSGKTVVAYLAAVQAAGAGLQTAVMAPTEILAEQHAETLERLGAAVGLRVGCLTAGVPAADRRRLESGAAEGLLDIVVGTHALVGGDVRFHRLGLVVVDEQHRFGVSQRLALVDKGGDRQPHLLVTTATPIPRSLAHAVYGELSVSLLDELPPGRVPPVTRAYARADRPAALRQLARALDAGGRAFVVCPRIDDGDDEALRSATTTAEELSKRFGAERVALLHGRMRGDERAAIMESFVGGDVRILVSTTVVEVGVDVPDANVMLVEHAERFGLAQLHQLRGRVGRRGQRSACLLVHDAVTPEAEARLSILCQTSDGFRIAEEDLALRGPGDLLGVRQSGMSSLRFGDLRRDVPLMEDARRAVAALFARDPELAEPEHAAARRALDALAEREAEIVREEAG